MAEKKSIAEEALLDIKTIQEALNANTKEILRSVAREEIDGLVKESLEEGDYTEEAVDDEETGDETAKVADDSSVEIGDGNDDDDDDVEVTDSGASTEVGPDDQGASMTPDDVGMGDDTEMPTDMTGASDDDVIAIYKKLSGDDEIEIVGDEIHLNIQEPGEYIVKKGALGMDDDEEDMEEGWTEEGYEDMEEGYEGMEEGYEEEGLTYEIAMEDESAMMKEDEKGNELPPPPAEIKVDLEESEEEEDESIKEAEEEDESVTEDMEEEGDQLEEKIGVGTNMSVGTHRNKTSKITSIENPKSKNESVSSKKVVTEAEVKYKKLLNEATQLKAENEEFRKALKKFRSMLVETVVFNSNLSYVTKLFMEHSTTKEEKKKIIQRFDEEVTNLKESKKLYKTIVNELSTRKPVNESVENKIIREVSTGSSKQLNEATAYVDPSTQRIKDLISRVENKDKY